MKKIVITLLGLLLFASPALAGGEWDFDFRGSGIASASDTTQGAIKTGITAAYVINKNLSAGIDVEQYTNDFAVQNISLLGRFNLRSNTTGFMPYVEAKIGALHVSFNPDGPIADVFDAKIELGLGVAAPVGENWSVLGKLSSLSDLTGGTAVDELAFGLGIRVNVGKD